MIPWRSYYVGIYGAWNGEYGFSAPNPRNGVRTQNSFPVATIDGIAHFQPFAVVVPWENGTTPVLPAKFAGPVHYSNPIPGDVRLAS